MALEPTEVLPAATGSATLTKTDSGWRIELDATGLPRLADGVFYQAWLRNEEGTLVPIGTFNEGEDVVLWAGVSPLLFPTLTVTREAADNVQDSSGDRVLVGTLTHRRLSPPPPQTAELSASKRGHGHLKQTERWGFNGCRPSRRPFRRGSPGWSRS